MIVGYTCRLRPGETAKAYLINEWGKCRWIWNQLVAEGIALSKKNPELAKEDRKSLGLDQANALLTIWRNATEGPTIEEESGTNWLRQGSSVAQQQTTRKFVRARSMAFSRKHGFPRFKSRDIAAPTLEYTRSGFGIRPHPETGHQALMLPGGVAIPVIWSDGVPTKDTWMPSSVTVFRDSIGHWYASFVVDAEFRQHRPSKSVIGVDWGVIETATTASMNSKRQVSVGADCDLIHAEHGKRAQANLARYQRMMARRRTPKNVANTKGYEEAKLLTAKTHKRVQRQRKDDANKWAVKVVATHGVIAVEDFKPKFLAKSTMAKKAADARIGAAKTALIWQATKRGREVILVDPAFTTMDCSNCGTRAKCRIPLRDRIFTCLSCGLVVSRDKNAAINMIVRAGFNPVGVEGVRRIKATYGRSPQPEPRTCTP